MSLRCYASSGKEGKGVVQPLTKTISLLTVSHPRKIQMCIENGGAGQEPAERWPLPLA